MHLFRLPCSSALVAAAILAHSAVGATSSSTATPPTADEWKKASRKAHTVVSQLNITEKIGLVTGGYTQPSLPCVGAIGGLEQIGFDGLCFSDGPAGYARSDGVSVFSSGITAAATWDRDLIYKRAVALGEEFRAKGAHVYLGPSSGPLGRHAVGGRNWESFGPDPYLAGVAMRASVLGIQSVGVQACSKHYIGNEQETQRTSTTQDNGTVIDAVSSNIDDRTLHELYLWPFADAVRAGTAGIMCSYNRANGNYSCANSETLTILKEELAFPGYVVSDWYATHGTASHANAGLDIEMPGNVSALAGPSYFGDLLLKAIKDGKVSESRLEEMAERVLTPYFLLGQDKDYPTVDPASGASFAVYQYGYSSPLLSQFPVIPARNVRGNHAKLIRQLGAAGTVLLKNVNDTLPLGSEKEIGIFGNGASYPTIGSVYLDYGSHPEGFEMGTVDIGGGSGTVRHTSLVTPLDAIRKKVEELGGRVQVLLDNKEIVDGRFRTIYPAPDVCLLFLKAYASEGQDRPSIELAWNATKAVENTAALCPNTVVVVHGPGVVTMPWADNENVTAILSAHYPGEETGNAIVDVLWGRAEPSGRLPYTIPKNLSDYGPPIVNLSQPVTDPDAWQADFDEGQMIDYRHFDANDMEPLYEFGFGLSYTQFKMANKLKLKIDSRISARADKSKGIAPGGLKDLWTPLAKVTVEVTNVGESAGTVVPQLYVYLPQDKTSKGTPVKSLRGFDKVHLRAGKTQLVTFELKRRDLSFWDQDKKEWAIPEGTFTFAAGFSSRDLRAKTKAAVLG
ncbi:glycoside hydrolase superfamily [Thelonectria olida]|uniref:Beta-glucosidase cel3A n=1 Tax=Thelonectria olida TaxID=1576542 RepID=A0A9P9AUB1_9HYPO|nr:glycoside hydrolase superfamily [Thelonectria olida]